MSNKFSEKELIKIKQWIMIQNKLNELNNTINKLKNIKKELEEPIIDFMIENNLEDNLIKYKDKQIKLKKETIKNQLSFKYLLEKLNIFFNYDTDLVEKICQFLKDERNTKFSYNLLLTKYIE